MTDDQGLVCAVFDNFYPDPHAVRQRAFDYEFVEPEDYYGWRTKRGFMPENFKSRLQKLVGRKIRHMPRPVGHPNDNGVFFLSFSKGKISEVPKPHYDDPLHHHVCLVYLSENVPVQCGTSFFRHKKTGLENYPAKKDLKRLGMTQTEAENILYRDSSYKNRWIETSRIGHKFNRAIIFPCRRLHAASAHFGSNLSNGRIYQLFTFELASSGMARPARGKKRAGT